MYLHSKDKESVKRQKAEVILFRQTIFEGQSAQTIAAKLENDIPDNKIEDVKIRMSEYNEDAAPYIIFYTEREEDDAEYAKRIEQLERHDIKEFAETLAKYNGCCLNKDIIKDIFTRNFTGDKVARLPDWQERLVRQFFNEKSTAELVQEAYDKGRADGEKKYNDLRETMKKTLTGK